ncbi:TPA: phage tail tape measure protein [Salmonella enterica subsp. enterica serovar Concord]|nr:phage tail tape measure protein [Salmonella enterica subsp. enterica serovar Concord]
MMARDFKLSMSLNLKDNASKLLASLLKEGTKQASEAEKAAKRQSEEQQKSTKAAISLERTRAAELRRNAKAREALGVSSEQSVQREIDRTIAAYNRLTRAGVMSATEQSRAFNQMRSRVAALRSELQGVTRLERARQTGRNVMTIAGGVAAAGAALVQPIRKQMSYSERLTEMTNTAFSDQDIAGRTAGMQRLDKLIRQNVQSSGLSKEGVMGAAGVLFGKGFSESAVNAILPVLTRTAAASKTDPEQLASVATKMMQTLHLTKDQIPAALNSMLVGGQKGGFEIADMVNGFPAQMAMAEQLGLSGMKGVNTLIKMNELGEVTAGSTDEASTNVVNLLQKINAPDTREKLKHVKVNGKGINLEATLAQAKAHGMNQVDAFVKIVETVASQNKEYVKLKKKLESLPKNDKSGKRELYESMFQIFQGAGIGEVVNDRQALLGLIAYMNGGKTSGEIDAALYQQQNLKPGEKSATDLNFEFNSQQPWYKADQAKNAWDFAQMDAVKGPAHLVGTFAGGLADAAEKFPGLATAVAGATTAIQAMTQAALAFAGLKFLTEGLGALTGKPGTKIPTRTPRVRVPASRGSALVGGLTGLLSMGMAVTETATATTPEEDEAVNGSKARWKRIHEKYPQSVIDAARKRYQPWYQFGEGYSTENERWIQQYLADKAAGKIPDDAVNPGQVPSPACDTVAPSQVLSVTDPRRYNSGLGGNQYPGQPQKIELNNKTVLEVDGQTLAEVVNRYNVQDAARGTGAGGGQ